MTGSSQFDAIVIGAGANGLVAAAAMGKAGKRVLLVDSAATIGGQSRTTEFAPGFRSAPLALDAGWVPPSVARGIGLAPMAAIHPQYSVTVPTGDGGVLAIARDPAHAAEAIRKYSVRDAERWPAFAVQLRALSGFLESLYQLPAPDVDTTSLGEIIPLLGLARKLRTLGRGDMTALLRALPMSVQDLLDDEFESPLLKAALGAGGVRDIRQGPRSGATAFVLLHYLVGAPAGSVRARSWWRAGPDAFNTAVESIARQHGVVIRTGVGVARVLVRDDRVSGVVLNDAEEVFAPVVISTADPAHTLLHLIDPVWLDPEFIQAVRNIKFRGCTAFVQYAVDTLPDMPGLDGLVTLTTSLDALERSADAAKYGAVSEHPHVEVSAPSLRWPHMAPAGKHVVVARVQYAPYELRNAAWDASRAATVGDAVTATIARAVPHFADSILHRSVLTPADIETQFSLTHGAVTHGEITLDQILFMRPVAGFGRYAMPISGLYLGGAGAHPGPGVLGGAGYLAARRVLQNRSR
jgi:phytoene dehydrogenase-like protein